ncbi:ferritin-like domain-containing protein [Photobacterium minamisatsumaniensis]|uniref:ferritin-like domain-containing protein n=1 Tax=Photobacterium minamisatsumaniensis TaxID=2910233 RepID=UPI003D137550
MLKCENMSELSFLTAGHYDIYLKGKERQNWDRNLDWSLAENDLVPEHLTDTVISVASLSAHVEVLGMQNAAELLANCEDFALKIGLGQAVNDEARHAELFSKYVTLANGNIRDLSKNTEIYDQHFSSLTDFDDIFLSHVFLENGALEQFNIFIQAFGADSLIGQIYKGALQDEARHVQMGINYFREQISKKPDKAKKIKDHLNEFKKILHVNDAGVYWLADISGRPYEEIKQRVNNRQSGFINKIIEEKCYV